MKEFFKSSPYGGGLSPDFDFSYHMNHPIGEEDYHLPVAVHFANKVQDERNKDPKTQLLNQQAWLDSYKRHAEKLELDDSMTVYVSDLNGFKGVNDKLGHDAGDELLGIVGQAYKNAFQRPLDIKAHGSRLPEDKNNSIARLGGDEFAVFVVKKASDKEGGCNLRFATNAEELENEPARINQELKKLLTHTRFEQFNISLSTGASELQPGDNPEGAFAKADLNMFKVKYAGKISNLDYEDIAQLKLIVPFLEKIGHRVEEWAHQAIQPVHPGA